MARNWIRGGIMAVCLGFAGFTAQAATITDATLDVTGDYRLKDGKYRFAGEFSADLLNNPKMDRAYDVGYTLAFGGKTVFSDMLPSSKVSDALFSIKDVLRGKLKSSGLARLLRGFDVSGKVNSSSDSADGDFEGKLGKSHSKLLHTACLSLFSSNASKKCEGPKEFTLSLVFSYDEPVPPLSDLSQPDQTLPGQDQVGSISPVPLPAGLPLLGGAMAAFAALRRKRR